MSIQLDVEVQEAQFILGVIAKQPFEQVADLWFKIKGQAEHQLSVQQAPQGPGAQSPGAQGAPEPTPEA